MARRTISLPGHVEAQVKENMEPGESFSAAIARLVIAGISARGRRKPLAYIASGKGPRDLGLNAERYLREPVEIR
ncbi:MAG: hypothetical protein HYY34_00995 [Chloroflexi bacterium]|nr:hypothetical protein [Chloroflexota bacterium]